MARRRPHDLRAQHDRQDGRGRGARRARRRCPRDLLRVEELIVTRRPVPFPGHERHQRLEVALGRPIAAALVQWNTVCHHTRAALNAPCNDWAEIIGPHARDLLENALETLPPREARWLGHRVAPLDAMFLDKTLQNPREDPDLPWWWRRTARG